MVDNKRLETTLSISVMDAMMLMDAVQIASNTAIMSGKADAMKRLDEYQKVLKGMVPEAAKHFDSRDWAEIGLALEHAKNFSISHQRDTWQSKWSREERIVIDVVLKDDAPEFAKTSWRSKSAFEPDHEVFKEVFDLLTEVAPLGCEGTLELETSSWKSLR